MARRWARPRESSPAWSGGFASGGAGQNRQAPCKPMPMMRPKLWLRLAVVLVLAGGLAYVAFNRGTVNPQAIQAQLDELGWALPLAFVAYHVVATLCFVPRFVMGAVAGALFGLWWGALWSLTGAMAGAAAGFLIAR